MRTRVKLSTSFVEEYKRILHVVRRGGDPPCVACSNHRIVMCAKTGHQCEAFEEYVRFLADDLRMSPHCGAGAYSTSRN